MQNCFYFMSNSLKLVSKSSLEYKLDVNFQLLYISVHICIIILVYYIIFVFTPFFSIFIESVIFFEFSLLVIKRKSIKNVLNNAGKIRSICHRSMKPEWLLQPASDRINNIVTLLFRLSTYISNVDL